MRKERDSEHTETINQSINEQKRKRESLYFSRAEVLAPDAEKRETVRVPFFFLKREKGGRAREERESLFSPRFLYSSCPAASPSPPPQTREREREFFHFHSRCLEREGV